ncbi:cytochrome C [Pseudoxanthomonas sp. 10H]|uniref:cytochrome C n=1 Tax=Pseudoxanthomonas sp. 10H TaxID=3242729 RepID=UPI003557195E
MQARHARRAILAAALLPAVLAACQRDADGASGAAIAAPAAPPGVDLVARGEYLVRVAGCNDCHTPAYAQSQGNVPKDQWLVGSPLGFHGPWGTTYATNLRLRMQDFSEAQWLAYSANLRTRPIMPDFAVRDMTEEDRRALYRFIRGLGPAGQPAPPALPPGQTPPLPYMALVLPQTPAAPVADAHSTGAPNAH